MGLVWVGQRYRRLRIRRVRSSRCLQNLRGSPPAPEPLRLGNSVDVMRFPPGFFVSDGVQGTMMEVAERHHPLVANFASKGPQLSKAQVMRLTGRAPADEAWKCPDVLAVLTVSDSFRRGDFERALIYSSYAGRAGLVLGGEPRQLRFEHVGEEVSEVRAFSRDEIGPMRL
jgi:hypothetical protein